MAASTEGAADGNAFDAAAPVRLLVLVTVALAIFVAGRERR